MRFALYAGMQLIVSCALAQDASTPISFVTRAARASEVVKQIASTAHVDLQVSPQLQDEVLVIAVKDQPLSAVMARIATVTSGQWKQEGSTYRLIADQAVRTQEERADLAKRIATVKKAISERVTGERKALEAMAKLQAKATADKSKTKGAKVDTKKAEVQAPPDGPDETGDMSMNYISSEEMAITHLLVGLDPSVLARMNPGDRLVFSSNPTQTQRTMGPDASEIINGFIMKHNEEVAKLPAGADSEMDSSGMDPQQLESMKRMMKMRTSKIGVVAKALLIVRKSQGFGMANEVEMRLYDSKGGVIFSADSGLNLGSSPNGMFTTDTSSGTDDAGPQKPKTPPTGKTPVEYSDDSKALNAAFKGVGSGNFKLNLSPELRRKMYAPDKFDPLSFDQTDNILAVAKAAGKPLVANISDEWGSGDFEIGPSSANSTVESVMADLESAKTEREVKDSDFEVVMPAEPVHSRAIRLNRSALANLLHAAELKGVPSLDDQVEFATQTSDESSGTVAIAYIVMFVPGGLMDAISGNSNRPMLRFYGHLPPEARATLAQGGKLAFANLTPGQRDELDRMTYGADAKLMVDDGQHPYDPNQPVWMQFLSTQMTSQDYREEPTEIAPNGVPPAGYVELHVTKESFASPQGIDSPVMGMLGMLGPDEMAMFTMMKDQKGSGSEQLDAILPTLGKLKIGDRSVMHFTFHVANQVVVHQLLRDQRFPDNALVVSANTLPSDFQKQIAARVEALKKSPFGAMGSMFSNEVIHP
ncbi:MAG: hypothetical protein P4L46_15345 [Fimbriimonas sp.]|nr:hypothetical protein [Fimbriimonas sp.]